MRRIRLLVSLAAAAVSLAAGVLVAPSGTAALSADRRPTPSIGLPTPSQHPPITILSVGDSLTVGGGLVLGSYRLELDRLLWLTGQPHTWRVEAEGGTKCSYWADRVDAIITTHQPHLIFLNCGTNDTPTTGVEAAYRTILTRAAARNVPVIASKIGIPDMRSPTNIVRPEIHDWHWQINQAIGRALADFPAVRWANFERIPNNPEWLQADGIHWTARADAGAAQKFYQAAAPLRGWKTFAQLGITEMCGLNGSWPWEPWPTGYVVCLS